MVLVRDELFVRVECGEWKLLILRCGRIRKCAEKFLELSDVVCGSLVGPNKKIGGKGGLDFVKNAKAWVFNRIKCLFVI